MSQFTECMGKQICISSVTRGAAEKAPSEQAAERRQEDNSWVHYETLEKKAIKGRQIMNRQLLDFYPFVAKKKSFSNFDNYKADNS